MRLRLLLIEDSESDALLIVQALTDAGHEVVSRRVASGETLRHALDSGDWDIAVANYAVDGLSGAVALKMVREHDVHLPFIFVSDSVDEHVAVDAMRTGAQDYLGKRSLARLAPAVERELREAGSRRARTRAEQRLVHLAYHDPLTDLPNRTLFEDRLQQAIARGQRENAAVSLLVMDLDGFKAINDALGHHAGDRVLQQVASRLRGFLREADTVARLGGDEFAVILPSTEERGAELTARKILVEIERPIVLDGQPFSIQASVGIAVFPGHGATVDALLQKADATMYVAKHEQAGCLLYSPDRDPRTHRRLSLIAELRQGLDEGQFMLEYQPVVDLRSGTPIAVEALVRWDHPEQGRLMPADFITLAEQTGLVDSLTMFVVDRALAERSTLAELPPASLSVNLSARNLHDRHFPEQIGDLLWKHGVPASQLALEITENLIMSDPARSTACLSRLHDMGVRLIVDDFGTGYSSLNFLRRLPVDQLKIDKSFVIGVDRGEDDVIVRSTIDLAHNMGMTVVAEGVETPAMWDRLMALGCDAAQGTFIGAPRSAVELAVWLAARAGERTADRG